MVQDLSLGEGTCQRCGAVERLARSGHCQGCQLEVQLLLEAILWRRHAQQLSARLPIIRALPVRAKALPMGWLVFASLLLLIAALLVRVRL